MCLDVGKLVNKVVGVFGSFFCCLSFFYEIGIKFISEIEEGDSIRSMRREDKV